MSAHVVLGFKKKLKLNPCIYICDRQRPRFGGCGIVSVLGRVPAPPSRTFKDAPDPSSQGGVGNGNQSHHMIDHPGHDPWLGVHASKDPWRSQYSLSHNS